MKKQPSANLELYFPGADTHPETIPVHALAGAVAAIHRLGSPEDTGGDQDQDHVSIRLLSVRRGSARFLCVAERPKELIPRLRLTGRLLASTEPSEKLGYALGSLKDLSEIAKSLKCPIVIRQPNAQRQLAEIQPDTYARIAGSLLIKMQKTITGSVQRVGGATERRCALRVPFQHRLLYCSVKTSALARELGKFLYEDVVVSGEAQCLRHSWKIVHLMIQDVVQRQPGPITQAFDALRRSGASAWDNIDDPIAFLTEVTGAN